MRLPSSASARPPSCAAGKCWASMRPPLFALSVLAQASKALVIGVPMPSVWAILQTNFFWANALRLMAGMARAARPSLVKVRRLMRIVRCELMEHSSRVLSLLSRSRFADRVLPAVETAMARPHSLSRRHRPPAMAGEHYAQRAIDCAIGPRQRRSQQICFSSSGCGTMEGRINPPPPGCRSGREGWSRSPASSSLKKRPAGSTPA